MPDRNCPRERLARAPPEHAAQARCEEPLKLRFACSKCCLSAIPALPMYFRGLAPGVGELEEADALILARDSDRSRPPASVLDFGLLHYTSPCPNASWITGVIVDNESSGPLQNPSLASSSSLLAQVIDLAEDAIISIGEDQRIVLFNQAAERIFGYSAKEAIGKPLDMLLPERMATLHRSPGEGVRPLGPDYAA